MCILYDMDEPVQFLLSYIVCESEIWIVAFEDFQACKTAIHRGFMKW